MKDDLKNLAGYAVAFVFVAAAGFVGAAAALWLFG